ncbi:uncharacterized protein LOC134801644 [Cydia splendana]|uniref:uncharacterized protein LOC134801644 n=1 Tax=Cydia splendana TaxID=1100963 RepID=UPI00300D94C0
MKMLRLFLVVAFMCSLYTLSNVGASPTRRKSRPPTLSPQRGPGPQLTTEEYALFYPIFGRVTPSPEIVAFADYVFGVRRDAKNNDNKNATRNKAASSEQEDSGELLRPKGANIHANIGFEQYWPGGDWVYRKAELERCNTTEYCGIFSKEKICAGNHDLTAHHTFENFCEMQDANCRDGTVTVYTESAVNENVTWFPVTTSGFIDMKIATRGPCWIVLARSRSIGSRFKRMFYYGFGEEQYDRTYYGIVALLKDEEEGPWDERKKLVHASYYRGKYKYDSAHINHTQFLRDGTKYQWRLTWNETTGSVLFDMILRDGTTFVPPNGRLQHSSAEYAYPVRYIGLAGGNASYPAWWELTGPGNFLIFQIVHTYIHTYITGSVTQRGSWPLTQESATLPYSAPLHASWVFRGRTGLFGLRHSSGIWDAPTDDFSNSNPRDA